MTSGSNPTVIRDNTARCFPQGSFTGEQPYEWAVSEDSDDDGRQTGYSLVQGCTALGAPSKQRFDRAERFAGYAEPIVQCFRLVCLDTPDSKSGGVPKPAIALRNMIPVPGGELTDEESGSEDSDLDDETNSDGWYCA